MVSNFSGFLKKYWLDILLIFLILMTTPLFFYKLGQSSLVNWDEAWYAGIARNILKSGDFLRLVWNGRPFFDHPPAGFWWMVISFKIFGISNFSARLPSAVFGILTLISTYFLGRQLFNKWVGFASAIALVSAPWFLYRARSGNLDIFLTFFFVFSIWLAIKSVKQKEAFLILGISLGLLFLTKTLIPFAIVPALAVIYFGKKIEWKWLLRGLSGFFLIVGVWFISQITLNAGFISRYFYIGLPGIDIKSSFFDNFRLFKTYLHVGIGKWFWPGVISVFTGLFVGKRPFYILSVFCLSFLLPFLFSNKTQIWHLIPLYPFIILIFFGFTYFIVEKFIKNKYIAPTLVILISFYFAFTLVRGEWFQFINIPAYISDEEILSKEAEKYADPLVVDWDFIPTAIFYSGKDSVKQTYIGELKNLFKSYPRMLLITQQSRLNSEKIPKSSYILSGLL
jgi:4-amino-4-deoxy-L-arabinose transferase-like glycosyltransferase